MGFCPRHGDGAAHRRAVQSNRGFPWRLFLIDGEHGCGAVWHEVGAIHRPVFLLSGMGAVRCQRRLDFAGFCQ